MSIRASEIACGGVILCLLGCAGGGTNALDSHTQAAIAINPPIATNPAALVSPTTGTNPNGGSQTNSAPSAQASTPPITVTGAATAAVVVNYALPSTVTSQSHTTRNLKYISTGNTLISVVVTPQGGASATYGPNLCTNASCNITFTANTGVNTLAFTLTDNLSRTLSSFTTTQIVEPVTLNTFNLSANPVVSSVVLALTPSTITAGSAADVSLTVSALDIAGKTIVGAGNYVDANGNPLSLNVNVANTQAGGDGLVQISGPSRITGSGQAAISLHYNGGWIGGATIGVTSSQSVSGTLGTAGLTITSKSTEYTTNLTANSQPFGIVAGPDGNLWFTEDASMNPSKVGKITTGGLITEYSAGITANSTPTAISVGPDGNLYFSEFNGAHVARLTTEGAVNEFVSLGAGSNPVNVVTGADGRLWTSNNGGSGGYSAITIAGAVTTVSPLSYVSPSYPQFILLGPDKNMWLVGNNIGKVLQIAPSGAIAAYPTVGTLSGSNLQCMTIGPDGNVWFTETTGDYVGKVTPAGAVTEYHLTVGSKPVGIVTGPDNYLWFAENGTNKIGRISTTGAISQYATGITGVAGPFFITVGPDGNLWFTEKTIARIAKFVFGGS